MNPPDVHWISNPSRDFGALLRQRRTERRYSQLALAAEAGISARHLSFLETGRAQPSRAMVSQLGAALDLSLVDRDSLSLAAGFAAQYGHRALDDTDLRYVSRALEFLLRQQEPFPCLVVDGGWNVRMRNDACLRIFETFRDEYEMGEGTANNAMHVVFHPKGLRPFIVNWHEFAGGMVDLLHREATVGGSALAKHLLAEILEYPGVPQSWRSSVPDPSPVLTMKLCKGGTALSFFTTLTTFALPRDSALQQLRLESFFPADAATEDFARRASGSRESHPSTHIQKESTDA